MIIGACAFKLRISWASSLKEKRMVVKSLTDKMKNRFNISVAEIEELDNHKVAVIAFSMVTNEVAHANSVIDKVINYVENNTDAEIFDIQTEIL